MQATGIIAALSLGFLGSFHCIGMCGPIALALPVHQAGALKKHLLIFSYNAGRVATYACFGLLSGAIGKGFAMAGLQQMLSVAIGVLILLGLLVPQVLKHRAHGRVFGFFNAVKQKLAALLQGKRRSSLFYIGLLNGLLPCGLVYAALSGAIATGTVWGGALFMAAFGLGTLPMMLALPHLGQYIGAAFRTRLRRAVPVFVSLMAVLLILRGLNLGIPYISPMVSTCHTAGDGHQPVAKIKTITCCKHP